MPTRSLPIRPTRRKALKLVAGSALNVGATVVAASALMSGDLSSPAGGALRPSPPIKARRNGEVFENLHIISDGEPCITSEGFSVEISNCLLEHRNGRGIALMNCDTAIISNTKVKHLERPTSTPLADDEQENIFGFKVGSFSLRNSSVSGGSSGVYLIECSDSTLFGIYGENFRGPYPRGQFVQFNRSPGSVLDTFECFCDLYNSYVEDNISIFYSDSVVVRNGLIIGNNSVNGWGVMFEESNKGRADHIDFSEMGCGAVAVVANKSRSVFDFSATNCRTQQNHLIGVGGRDAPSSRGLCFGAFGERLKPASSIRFHNCAYFDVADPYNIFYNSLFFDRADFREVEFTLRRQDIPIGGAPDLR